ncbi:MAG: molybdenum cofactor guanylyltransferase [Acidobacteria bacterium]|nr:molybdenum cofactor guanylyltransferase [Acidobacteriota bacterium]MBI3425857.1 molybdenum cofactor guanylyltransferase [Acidobacteriota bacterium]
MAIQAGGRSSRMGTDKAWAELSGRPLIEHVLRAAQPLAQRFTVVLSHDTPQRERYQQLAAHWQAKLLFDANDYCGPLGGIQTALLDCQPTETALILACDLPRLTPAFLAFLQTQHAASAATTITIPLDHAGRRQMLSGFYQPSCLPAVQQMLYEGLLRIDKLCSRVPVCEVAFANYAHLPHAATLLNNLNTPAELRLAAGETA